MRDRREIGEERADQIAQTLDRLVIGLDQPDERQAGQRRQRAIELLRGAAGCSGCEAERLEIADLPRLGLVEKRRDVAAQIGRLGQDRAARGRVLTALELVGGAEPGAADAARTGSG